MESENKTQSIADKIWEEIKDMKIDMFSLPNQVVSNYCRQIAIDPSKLYIIPNASALLPALDTALQGKYNVERIDKYLVISPIK